MTDDGLPLVFSGAELSANYNSAGFAVHRTFAFEDLEGDGTMEIVEAGPDSVDVHVVHRWTGECFKPPGPGNGVLFRE
mgnify:CR=1 FL=1